MSRVDLEFNAEEVYVEHDKTGVRVRIQDAEGDDIMESFTAKDLLDYWTAGELLSVIGREEAIDFFNIIEAED